MNPDVFLIAESGSTKTEWRICEKGKPNLSFKSQGFNPNVMAIETIDQLLMEVKKSHLHKQVIDQVFFYGAGLRGNIPNLVMKKALQRLLPTSEIEVNHDLMAAVRSTGRTSGIVGILGTGSNSCLYKNHEIQEILGGHGYIFGDEGAGADLGKHLIKGFLENRFPLKALKKLEEVENADILTLRNAVINDPKPNVRLAEMARNIPDLLTFPTIRRMVLNRFTAYLDSTICRYADSESLFVDFVGSISHYFSPLLLEACQLRNIKVGKIDKNPIDGLVRFHGNF